MIPTKFLSIDAPDPRASGAPPTPEHVSSMQKLVEENTKSSLAVAIGGLLPVSRGSARLRSEEGEITITEGPFAESNELIAVRRFLAIAGDSESELRQIPEPGDSAERQRSRSLAARHSQLAGE